MTIYSNKESGGCRSTEPRRSSLRGGSGGRGRGATSLRGGEGMVGDTLKGSISTFAEAECRDCDRDYGSTSDRS